MKALVILWMMEQWEGYSKEVSYIPITLARCARSFFADKLNHHGSIMDFSKKNTHTPMSADVYQYEASNAAAQWPKLSKFVQNLC